MKSRSGLDIGYRVEAARKLRGLTQNGLCLKAGVGESVVCNLEKGHTTPRVDTLAALAEALEVSLNWLVYGNHPPKADRNLMKRLVLYEQKLEE